MSEETMTPETGSGDDLTVVESVAGFENFLDASEPSTEQAPVAEEVEEEAIEDTDESDEGSEDLEEGSDEDSEEEVEETEEDEPQLYTVKAAGEDKEVTIEELVSNYQLGADYTKKTQELSENRKAVESQAKAINEATQVRDLYAQRLQAVEALLVNGGNDSPEELADLKENDRVEYAIRIADITEKREQLNALRAEQGRIAQQQQADQAKSLQLQTSQEMVKLAELLPEFSDPAKGEQVRNEIRNYAKSIGFADNEVSNVRDAREVLVLYKAAMYDKLQKSKPGVKKRVAEAPKMVKSGTRVTQQNNDIIKKQKSKLKGSGHVRDAAKLFENFI